MRSKKAAYSVINSSHVAQVKSAWQTGCWAANTNTFFARSRIFAKVSFVYKDRSLCAQQPICDNSLLQSALCFPRASTLVFGVSSMPLCLQLSPKTCFPCSVCSLCTCLCGGKGTHFEGFGPRLLYAAVHMYVGHNIHCK